VATFVLVHGAMHGGWCWRDVRRRLEAAGHDVHTPSLTGQGERRRSLTPDVGLSTHVADLTDLLWFEDLDDVHLVLHSYAGALAGPVADQRGDRLAGVVYLGAFVTRPGQSLLDVEPPAVGARYRELAARAGDGWYVPASDRFLDQWGSPTTASGPSSGPGCATSPSAASPSRPRSTPRPSTACARSTCATRTRRSPAWRPVPPSRSGGLEFHDVPCGHDMMLEAPGTVADLLETVVADPAASGPAPR